MLLFVHLFNGFIYLMFLTHCLSLFSQVWSIHPIYIAISIRPGGVMFHTWLVSLFEFTFTMDVKTLFQHWVDWFHKIGQQDSHYRIGVPLTTGFVFCFVFLFLLLPVYQHYAIARAVWFYCHTGLQHIGLRAKINWPTIILPYQTHKQGQWQVHLLGFWHAILMILIYYQNIKWYET